MFVSQLHLKRGQDFTLYRTLIYISILVTRVVCFCVCGLTMFGHYLGGVTKFI